MINGLPGYRKYNPELLINSLVKEVKAIVINLDSSESNRWSPLEVEGQRIRIKDVIDSEGNVVPFESIPEETNITKDHWLQISKIVEFLDKETLMKLRNE
ncbi:hypothetical protein A8L34_27855 [Bacillus sp. FJAT-27264]|uniref:hypothetical protein n=1 Tax=Paenibacillus sp. (strain DSM 101736 / FJAT-27264) TaxID=1850362 RepID=UPI00080803D1|nr:hypothetical protein [Bacillus sp. FJAT-27264]OBZ15864.1 hypothetical protein A8L34_27855 [Bacillus sp. FJAT-27264]